MPEVVIMNLFNKSNLKKILHFDKLGIRISLLMSLMIIIIIIFSTISYFMNQKVQFETIKVSESEIPTSIISISMIDEIDDMNSNILEYVLGESEEKAEFALNAKEFRSYLFQLNKINPDDKYKVELLSKLFEEYYTLVQSDIFGMYSPENEIWARERVKALTKYTGKELETLLDNLKDKKIFAASKNKNLNKVVNNDLPSVRYYLELVDEAGGMIDKLNLYINGDNDAKEIFLSDAQRFENFLELLKQISISKDEKEALSNISALYKVLRDGGLEVFEKYKPDNKKSAIQSIDQLEHKILNQLESNLDDFSATAKNAADISLGRLRSQTNIMNSALLLLLLMVIIFNIGIALYFYKTISIPITSLGNSLIELTKGNLNITVPYTYKDDEIGDMAKSFDVFKRTLIEKDNAKLMLEESIKKAEKANQSKGDFLANMSHEIRTPLNAIIGINNLMLKTDLDEKQEKYLNNSNIAAQNLLSIINDILNYSKIEAGKLQLEKIGFNVDNILNEVKTVTGYKAEEKKLKFLIDKADDIPENLIGDPLRITQILLNLVNNAIKFTEIGSITIKVDIIEKFREKLVLQFMVKDTGIGLTKDEQKKLFRAFTQVDSSTSRKYGGTGLGLSISRQLCKLMGGEIKVESKINYGSSFSFTVVVGLTDKIDNIQKSFKVDSQYKQNVLIVDDDDIQREILTNYLTDFNMNSDSVPSGEEAIKIIEDNLINNKNYDLILMDWKMDGITGLEAWRQIKKLKFKGKLPEIIMVTGHWQKGLSILAQKEGINDILTKPIQQSVLFDSINSCTKKNIKEVKPIKDEIEISNVNDYKILLVDDNHINLDVARDSLEHERFNVETANSGKEALEILDRGKRYNVILLDLQMPDMDGYETAKHIRENIKYNHIPIIALSADAMTGTRDKVLKAGMDDYVTKPIDMDQLLNVLQRWI